MAEKKISTYEVRIWGRHYRIEVDENGRVCSVTVLPHGDGG